MLYRLYRSGSKVSEGAVMAADASLPLERVSGAMHAMFDMLSKPDTLPELTALQVIQLKATQAHTTESCLFSPHGSGAAIYGLSELDKLLCWTWAVRK